MKSQTLIIRGVDSIDDLPALGLGVAQKYSESKWVILIDKNDKCRLVKGGEREVSLIGMQYVDVAKL